MATRRRSGRTPARRALCVALLLGCSLALSPATAPAHDAPGVVHAVPAVPAVSAVPAVPAVPAVSAVRTVRAVPAVRAVGPVGTYPYGGHARQRLTAYAAYGLPPEVAPVGPAPGLLIVHGGYWAHDTDWESWARTFATLGFVVFDVDYRLNSDARWPAQRDDLLAALGWVRRHADGFGVAPDRLLLLGSSAGGQIAASVGAYGAGGARVSGVIGLSPVASPHRAWQDGGRPGARAEQRVLRREAERLAGCRPDSRRSACRRVWRDAAVGGHASGADDAPMYLLHSAEDFVPVAHSDDLAEAERAAGMAERDMVVELVPGSAHGAALLREPEVLALVLAWAREHSG